MEWVKLDGLVNTLQYYHRGSSLAHSMVFSFFQDGFLDTALESNIANIANIDTALIADGITTAANDQPDIDLTKVLFSSLKLVP
jgi:hypothetical protein